VDLEFLRTNYPELLRLFNVVIILHDKDYEGVRTIQDLAACFFTAYPNAKLESVNELLAQVSQAEGEEALIVEYLVSVQQRVGASKAAFALLDYAEGKTSHQNLTEILQPLLLEKEIISNEVADKFVSDDIEELYNATVGKGGLEWRLKSLNRSLGPLRKGDFGFIFARPETGKTTFLASEVTHMATQTEAPILWINNEEQGEKVLLRCYEASLGSPLEEILASMPRARDAFYQRTGRRIQLFDDFGVKWTDVERLCRNLQPALIVVDQLDKIKGFDGDREDLRMGAIYQWARELSKQFAPVIGVSQSDGSGEGVKYLNMGNVANAKTSKQAEADWILGIGVDFNDHVALRGFSICKNKLIGGEQSVAKMRHGKFDVLIEPEIARYKDIAHE
jgi:replicative DNA helicase